ncbi:MAG: bifunctional riboflavin kinase/FAD synthetase [Nitriliruptorales bacterium]|nr:bifunctional riboflavin kinase/FAD synthetase [Nitriliruptorales bacterium]
MTRVVHSLEELDHAPSVVTIGVFDGVHRGHQTIIRRAVDDARERDCRSVAVTFDRHPEEVVRPDDVPPYLQTLDAKIETLTEQGLDVVFVLAFTPDLAELSPGQFIDRVLLGPLSVTAVVIGANFRFGHRAAGDIDTLTAAGQRHGFEVDAVDLLGADQAAISSTAIRAHLAEGDVAWAAQALGRPYRLRGTVGRGDGRGRSIGVPTANLDVEGRQLIPAVGVYAGHVRVLGDGARYPCVTNIGSRPTFGGQDVTVEAHLFDVDLDLYDHELELGFSYRIRDERRFDGPEELVAQIHRDVERARSLLGADGDTVE